MKVKVDSWAWIPKGELTPMQVSALKASLTVVPRKFSGFPGGEPTPIKLYVEDGPHIGIPRAYFMENRKEHHEIDDRTTLGREDLWDGPLVFAGKLRDSQKDALKIVSESFRNGSYGGLVRAVTGWGKTVWSCALMAEMKVPTLVVVHKEFLVNQWKERIEQFLPGTRVGIVQQNRCEYKDYGVAIGMIHSLVGSRDYGDDFWSWPGLIISDECFPAGTLVATADGESKAIEYFQVGDDVLSAAGRDTVAKVFRKEVSVAQLRLVRLEDGSEFICTANHPLLSASEGWIPASEVEGHLVLTVSGCIDTMSSHGYSAEDSVSQDSSNLSAVRETQLREERQEVLLSRLYGTSQSTDGSAAPLRVVWHGESEAKTKSFLWRCLSAELASGAPEGSVCGTIRTNEEVASGQPFDSAGGFYSDEETKSDEERRGAREGVAHVTNDGTSTSGSGRERLRINQSPTTATSVSRQRMGIGACGSHEAASVKPATSAVSLQAGFGTSSEEDSGRDRRIVSRDRISDGKRSEEIDLAAVLRVDSVTIPQRSDFERLGWGNIDNTGRVVVYNLAVTNHPSYVLHDSKLLVHNCHRVGAETWSAVPTKFKARWRLGVSATPRRKDGAENVFYYHIGKILYASKEQRMSPKIRRVWTNFKMVQTPTLNPSMVSKNVMLKFMCGNKARNKAIVDQIILAVSAGRKPIVLSERLNHLDAIDAMFRRDWEQEKKTSAPSVGFYVGGMKEEELEEAAKAQVIFATRQFAEEGLDIPALDTIFLTTPFSDVEQAVGRILRPCDGKKDPIVVDIRDDAVPFCVKSATYRDNFYQKMGW